MYRVLIVEDEAIIKKGLTYMFDWTANDCILIGDAGNGIEGLEKIRELTPDIVITDIRMPFKDGLQMLTESICEFDYKAIIISGYDEFEYAKNAISIGVSEYLLKPINFDELSLAIEKIGSEIDEMNQIKEHLKSLEDIQLYQDILNIKHYNYTDNKSKLVRSMIDYIEENYDKKISITDLCDSLNLSSVYLNTMFKNVTGYTFNDFLNRFRILKSVQLLKMGDSKIYEISEIVGFLDYKYFSQVFKKYVGLSPTMFLESLNSR